MKPGELFITISTWEGFQLIKTEEGTWFPKLEFKGLFAPFIKRLLPPNTVVMYIEDSDSDSIGVFLIEDKFYELPYNILKKI